MKVENVVSPPLGAFTWTRERHGVWMPQRGSLAMFETKVPLKRAELLFTTGTGDWTKREWFTADAVFGTDGRVTATVPDAATVYYLNVIDDRGVVASTEHEEVGQEPAQ